MTGTEVAAIFRDEPLSADSDEQRRALPGLPIRSGLALVACAVALIGLETLAYTVHGPFEWTAARLWALGGAGFVAMGGLAIARAAAGAIRDRCLTSLIMILVVCFVALLGISGIDHVQIQHEATQQIADGLNADRITTKGGKAWYPATVKSVLETATKWAGVSSVAVRSASEPRPASGRTRARRAA